jgi:hypothetical protein
MEQRLYQIEQDGAEAGPWPEAQAETTAEVELRASAISEVD